MTTKRMLLLLGSMAALVAFVAPAAAQASGKFWYSDPGHSKLGGPTANGKDVAGTGAQSWISALNGLRSGPCAVDFTARLWNGATMGEGEINSFTITASHAAPCPTNGPGTCKLATVTANGLPWTVTLTTSPMIIKGASFTKRYTGCAGIGIPEEFGMTSGPGEITGTISEGGVISFVNAGDLQLAAPLEGSIQIDGEVEIPSITTTSN